MFSSIIICILRCNIIRGRNKKSPHYYRIPQHEFVIAKSIGEREKRKERENYVKAYIHTSTYIHTYIPTDIQIHRHKHKEKSGQRLHIC